MEYINPNQLKRDENQPRTVFDEEKIKKLSETFTHFGLVDPIEIDEDNIIIRGERRWRASLIAKLDKVPVERKVGISIKERLERQLLEAEGYNHIDKAWSYATAIVNINQNEKEYTIQEVKNIDKSHLLKLISESKGGGGGTYGTGKMMKSGQSKLSQTIGVPQPTINFHLKLLKLHSDVQDKIEDIGVSFAEEISKIGDEKLQLKILDGITRLKEQPKEIILTKEESKDLALKRDEVRKWVTILKEEPEAENLFDEIITLKIDDKGRDASIKIFEASIERGHTPTKEEMTTISQFIKESEDVKDKWTDMKIEQATDVLVTGKSIEIIKIIPDADQQILDDYYEIKRRVHDIYFDHIYHLKTEEAKNNAIDILWDIYNHSKLQLKKLKQLPDIDKDTTIINVERK